MTNSNFDLTRFGTLILLKIITIFAFTNAHADVIYNQSANALNAIQFVESGRGIYDNFTLTNSVSLTGIEFTGGFLAHSSLAQPNPSVSFNAVLIVEDLNGQPDGLSLFNNSAFTSQLISSNATEIVNRYSIDFSAQPIQLLANQQYWFIMNPNFDSTTGWNWLWASGTGGDGSSLRFDAVANSRFTENFDRNFTLIGKETNVPEPETPLLIGFGFFVYRIFRESSTVKGNNGKKSLSQTNSQAWG